MEEQAQTTASGIGAALRRARERRGVRIEDASRDTCISVTYLNALERGAPLAAFPAPVYARGFLRGYARYLGLQAEGLADRFWAGEQAPDPITQWPLDPAPGIAERPRRLLADLRLRTR